MLGPIQHVEPYQHSVGVRGALAAEWCVDGLRAQVLANTVWAAAVAQAHAILALCHVYHTHANRLGHINFSACWMSFGKPTKQSAERYCLQDNADAVWTIPRRGFR